MYTNPNHYKGSSWNMEQAHQFQYTQQQTLLPQDHYRRVAYKNSRHEQALMLLVLLPIGAIFLAVCLAGIIWLFIHGPIQVPMQDTRLTSIVISTSSKIAAIIISMAFVRSAWASFVPRIVAGHSMTTRTIATVCRDFMSLGQFQNFKALPRAFQFHLILGSMTLLSMIATSSSFRYDSLSTSGIMTALVPDVAFACPVEKVIESGLFFCDEGGDSSVNINSNTSIHAWDYIGEVAAGGQNTVTKYGNIGDETVGANVTLAILPEGWTLGKSSDLPWMAMWVACQERSISVEFSGSGYNTNTTVYLNGKFAALLDIGNMPQWGSIVHIFLRVNETGPFSSLGEYDVIMLARNGIDGANLQGVDDDSITKLGVTYLNLKGYGATRQGLLGAASRCTFRAETGGRWQEGLWPPLNHTKNTIWGELVNDRPTLATAMLNYGASWQYNLVSENSLPGGSVSYIANNTGADVRFSDFFASYIRNQWALIAYAIPRQTYKKLEQNFSGTGPKKLFISVTLVAVFPVTALTIGLLVTLRALVATMTKKYWVNRVEFEGWWLLKALRPDLYPGGFCNATEDKFNEASENVSVQYCDVRPESDVGHLTLHSTISTGGSVNGLREDRIYGLHEK
ncbi:hypothetical protein TWF730_003254 [Orbilia blumenaviensis]|uniref:Uncharacterized protein n=1 Tax=Orbilia blumenaviensis TaxID=1796055 RepID=A0AAV9U538_9PEZI